MNEKVLVDAHKEINRSITELEGHGFVMDGFPDEGDYEELKADLVYMKGLIDKGLKRIEAYETIKQNKGE